MFFFFLALLTYFFLIVLVDFRGNFLPNGIAQEWPKMVQAAPVWAKMVTKMAQPRSKMDRHHSLLLRLCLHLRTAALRSYVICTHLFRTAAGDLPYRVDHMARNDHVCLIAVCQILIFTRGLPSWFRSLEQRTFWRMLALQC